MIGDLVNGAAGIIAPSFGAAASHGPASPPYPHAGMAQAAAPFPQQQLSVMAGGASAFSAAAFRWREAVSKVVIYRAPVYIYGPWIALTREIRFTNAEHYHALMKGLVEEHPGDLIDDTEARAEFMRMELGHD